MFMLMKILIFLLIFLFAQNAEASILLDRIVAVVNKEVITWSELYKMMEYEAADKIRALSEQERLKIFKDNEKIFLEQLIDQKLQIQEAKGLGYEVSKEELNEAIENIKNKYSLTDDEFKASLEKEGMTFEEYKERLSEQILISKFVNRHIRNKIVVSDEEIKRYIESNKDKFDNIETFRIRQIFFKKPQDEANKIKIEEKAKLILEKLKEGEDFSILAKEYSDDPSAKTGGELGLIKKNLLASEFIKVLSELKAGDVSEPFWTEKGLHIIKLEEKFTAKSIEEISEDVREQLMETKFIEKYRDYIKSLREKARIDIRL